MAPPGRRYRIEEHVDPSQTRVLRSFLTRRGWCETDGSDWRLFWSFDLHRPEVFAELEPGRWVNHFPGALSIHSKDDLYLHLAGARRRLERHGLGHTLDFFPESFPLPDYRDDFLTAAASEPEQVWLLKPARRARGLGIELVADPAELPAEVAKGSWLVQRYIDDPLLLPDLPIKHVLRLHMLVASLDPLVLFTYPQGVVRFTCRDYRPVRSGCRDPIALFINPYRLHGENAEGRVRSLDFHQYRQRLRAAGIDDSKLWRQMRRLMIQTAIVHREPLLAGSRLHTDQLGCCYELLGFDVLIDEHLKPWLLECNISPAVDVSAPLGSRSREAQRRAREPLIEDMIQLLGIAGESDSNDQPWSAERIHAALERGGDFELAYPAEDAADFRSFFQRFSEKDLALAHGLLVEP